MLQSNVETTKHISSFCNVVKHKVSRRSWRLGY